MCAGGWAFRWCANHARHFRRHHCHPPQEIGKLLWASPNTGEADCVSSLLLLLLHPLSPTNLHPMYANCRPHLHCTAFGCSGPVAACSYQCVGTSCSELYIRSYQLKSCGNSITWDFDNMCPVFQEPAAGQKVAARKVHKAESASMSPVRLVDNAQETSGDQSTSVSSLHIADTIQVLLTASTCRATERTECQAMHHRCPCISRIILHA